MDEPSPSEGGKEDAFKTARKAPLQRFLDHTASSSLESSAHTFRIRFADSFHPAHKSLGKSDPVLRGDMTTPSKITGLQTGQLNGPAKTLIAIDPGKNGGIAAATDDRFIGCWPMPQTDGDILGLLRELVTDPAYTVAVVEQVGGFAGHGQPGSAMFKFGHNFGFFLGVLMTMEVRVELVRPQRWQKALSLGTASSCSSKGDWKRKLKGAAQRLFPGVPVTLATADALLLLEYGLKQHRVGASPNSSASQLPDEDQVHGQ